MRVAATTRGQAPGPTRTPGSAPGRREHQSDAGTGWPQAPATTEQRAAATTEHQASRMQCRNTARACARQHGEATSSAARMSAASGARTRTRLQFSASVAQCGYPCSAQLLEFPVGRGTRIFASGARLADADGIWQVESAAGVALGQGGNVGKARNRSRDDVLGWVNAFVGTRATPR